MELVNVQMESGQNENEIGKHINESRPKSKKFAYTNAFRPKIKNE